MRVRRRRGRHYRKRTFAGSRPGGMVAIAIVVLAVAAVAIVSTRDSGPSDAVRTQRSPAVTTTSPAADPNSTTTAVPRPIQDPVVVAAGDIACDPHGVESPRNLAAGRVCAQGITALLAAAQHPAAVLPLGDLQYESATLDDFRASYDLTWGRFKSITRPAIGNHEYETPGASGYFDYFGAPAGPSGGYYSYDVGTWHLIALNSNCTKVAGGCGADSPQAHWLRADLAQHRNRCTLAYWHHPRFSSGKHGGESQTAVFWRDLFAAGTEVVLVGHDHNYERFAPQTPDAVNDPAHGIREFVVGTGGRSHEKLPFVAANSEMRAPDVFGVLRLTLHADSYDWQFVAAPGATFSDGGSTACH